MKISEEQKQYLKGQLQYDHIEHLPPPNTLVVHQMQHRLIIDAVKAYASQNEMHMLDIGCGWGDFSEKLAPYLKSYIGIEPSHSELKQFQRKPNHYLVRGVGEYADFIRDGSRNFILLNSVLDHGFDWRKMFANCLRILAPGGLLVISMENSGKLPVRLRKRLALKAIHEGHLSFWGVEEVENLLAPDFQILEKRTLGFLFGFHHLTRLIPLPLSVLRLVNRAANKIAGAVDPNGGHILFFSARRNGETPSDSPFDHPFCCPECRADWAFGEAQCRQCGLPMHYLDGEILDSFELNKPLIREINQPSRELSG